MEAEKKWIDIIVGDSAHIFIWLVMQDDNWSIISDTSDHDTFYCKAYVDITKAIVDAYNDVYPEYPINYKSSKKVGKNMFKCQEPKCAASINNGDSLYNCGNGIWKCLKHSKRKADPVAELITANNKKVKPS